METEIFKIISIRDTYGYYSYTWKHLMNSTKNEWLESKDSFGSIGTCLADFLKERARIQIDADELDESLLEDE